MEVTVASEVEEEALVVEVGLLSLACRDLLGVLLTSQEEVEVEDEVDSQVTDHPIPSRVCPTKRFDSSETNNQRSDHSYTPSNPRCYAL